MPQGPIIQSTLFPVLEDVTSLWRSLVNDTFPGLLGTQGRIATDNAPFTLPFFNTGYTRVLRKMRTEGCQNLIVDGFLILNLPPVVEPNPAIFVSVGYNGYNNGTQNYGDRKLPADCMQVEVVRQRTTGSNLQFVPMIQSEEGLASGYQNNWLGQWEWRGYQIVMNGSLQAQDVMIRYRNQPAALNPPVADFAETNVGVIDSTAAIAFYMAYLFGLARGANPQLLAEVKAESNDALDDMIFEYVRRAQTVTYQRISYKDGGSDNYQNTTLGTSGTVG